MTLVVTLKNKVKVTIPWVENFAFGGTIAVIKTYGNEPQTTREVEFVEGYTNLDMIRASEGK